MTLHHPTTTEPLKLAHRPVPALILKGCGCEVNIREDGCREMGWVMEGWAMMREESVKTMRMIYLLYSLLK